MMRFFKRWKSRWSKASSAQKPTSEISIRIYPDRFEASLYGDERDMVGVLSAIMFDNQQARRIITNSVIAAEKEYERQKAFSKLMAINLN